MLETVSQINYTYDTQPMLNNGKLTMESEEKYVKYIQR